MEWAKPEAEQGNADAQWNLAHCYEFGMGVEKDVKTAVKWYRAAAEQGSADAQYHLARCYQTGKGVEMNTKKSIELYEKAAKHGRSDAMERLGSIYYKGEGCEVDREKAYKWYRLSAENGNMISMLEVAEMIEKGDGVTRDLGEARKWYAKVVAEHADAKGFQQYFISQARRGLERVLAAPVEEQVFNQKGETLVIKGLYLGMQSSEARNLIQHLSGISYANNIESVDGRVVKFVLRRTQVDVMFGTSGVSAERFCDCICSAYPLVKTFTVGEISDDDDMGRYKYIYESDKGFVLEVCPSEPNQFFILRAISKINMSNFD